MNATGGEKAMDQSASTRVESVTPTGCCEPFDPAFWQDQKIVWKDKPFVKDHVRCLFHVPVGLGRKVIRDMALIQAAGAQVDQQLMLSDDKSPWGADLYIEVAKAVPGATMDRLSGTFLTKVFEGPFRDAGKWAEQMRSYVAQQGEVMD